VEKTPFSVLELPPGADVRTARTQYRRLAREHHPDSASRTRRENATHLMAELNWAMEEIERNPSRWGVHAETEESRHGAEAKPVSVTPTLVLLDKDNRFAGYVTAAAPGVDGASVRLRYAPNLIAVERLPAFDGVANFRIRLADGVQELAAPARERLEIRAPHCKPVEVSVAIEPFTADDAPSVSEEATAGRCWLELVLIAGTLVLGAATALLYLT
jgi:hypothetical protein